MHSVTIAPGRLCGKLRMPPSKSHTMRAILFGAMGHGRTTIHDYLHSPDTAAMVRAMQLLGVPVRVSPETIEIDGIGGELKPAEDVIDAGNSGLVLRLVGALAGLLPSYTILTGDHSIRHNRPVMPMLGAMEQLGAFAVSSRRDGRAPIVVRGPLHAGVATLSGEDSQPVSAMLIATSFLEGKSQLFVTDPGETPWIDLTLFWLRRLGARITHHHYSHYCIEGNLRYDGFEESLPGDFSSAAFPLVAALITGSELVLENLSMENPQGDEALVEQLIQMGARIEVDPKGRRLIVQRGGRIGGGRIDVGRFVDALPILAVVGCFAEEPVEIVNGSIARTKESDRISAIATELRKMGAAIEEREDGLLVVPQPLRGAQLASHHDHRIAMALAVAALGAKGESQLSGAGCVAKTYSNFFSDLKIGV